MRSATSFKKYSLIFFVLIILLGIYWAISQPVKIDKLVVYTSRKAHLIQPIFDAYTKETGIQIDYITGKAGALIERLKAEGHHSPADILITSDVGNLWNAVQSNVLQPINSQILKQAIPENLRDPNNYWFGLSKRVRTIVYDSKRVIPQELSTYEDLGSPKWRKRLCLRTSKKVYNQSLVAMMIYYLGYEKTLDVVSNWVDNLAIKPFSSDTKTIEAIIAGKCDVALVNTYYLGRMKKKNPDLRVKIFWPNQNDRGAHVNISGGGLVASSKHVRTATKFLEWVATKGQALFADLNIEYPVSPNADINKIARDFGEFKEDQADLSIVGVLQKDAVRLMDEAGYK